MRPLVRPPDAPWALEDLAREWNCSEDQIRIYAAYSGLQMLSAPVGGAEVPAVTAEEKRRFERDHGAELLDGNGYNPSERTTHLYLIGVMASLWMWGEPKASQHYPIRDQIAGDAAIKEITMLRSRETDALVIKAGLDLLRQHGQLRPELKLIETPKREDKPGGDVTAAK